MNINRRTLIKLGIQSIPALYFLNSCTLNSDKLSIEDFPYIIGADVDIPKKRNYAVTIWDINKAKIDRIVTSHHVHSIVLNPVNKNIVYALGERPSTTSTIIDVKTKKVVNEFFDTKGYYFYGHGLVSADGKLLYCTENHFKTGEGIISIRDASNGKILDQLPSFGYAPHEMKYLSNGLIAVANSGHAGLTTVKDEEYILENVVQPRDNLQSSLVVIDPIKKKKVKEFKIDTKYKDVTIRHLDIDENDTVYMSLRQYNYTDADPQFLEVPPVAYLKKNSEKIEYFQSNLKTNNILKRFSLSVCANDKTGIIGVTHPDSHAITFWSIKDLKFLHVYKMQKPLGISISPNNNNFIVFNEIGEFQLFDGNTTKRLPVSKQPAMLNTSHVYSRHNLL